ncbi:MAG: cobalamin biosynthesis protein CbiD [Syntrophothermus sp.]|uniref:cobalt-precorrin-5B (C(1))-methyltransferase CbiD n=1 Tax=Syntrophothermus sp. TaxID=2736299 RepID=UPI00258028F5|nr:cobalt-precorrin-5B (C(1))-methyltransferase CbiD [Syntrophothermus sp.]NSW82378.1 cobalamin biosynthesis protein CbiD [Syntrophothermus sp.]
MNHYVVVNGRKLRKGYTTGSCAAAAAQAATRMLVTGVPLESIEIEVPAGIKLRLAVDNVTIQPDWAMCSVRKDGGDDPDVTTGLDVFAKVSFAAHARVDICAGEGVGIVTKPGLGIAVGEPAINPVPRRMILDAVRTELPPGQGVEVTIFIPGGKEVAEKTFNPRLGIEGGLSILGTTGIVEPMSEEALKEALILKVKVLAASGCKQAVLVPGKYGEKFATTKLGLPHEMVVISSNFIGFLLDSCLEQGFEDLLIVGHIGKLIKIAGGIFHTHSRVADARMEILSAFASLHGADRDTIAQLLDCPTSDAALDIIRERGLEGVYQYVAERVSARCRQRLQGRVRVGTIVYAGKGSLLAMDTAGKQLWEEFLHV